MQFLSALWLPILVSGFAVFVMSALAWTVLPHHKKEYGKLPNEDEVLRAIRAGNPALGLYTLPHVADQAEMNTPECKAKMEAGPMAYVTVIPPGMPPMGPVMAKSLLSNVIVSAFVAYLAFNAVPAGADYLHVFRIAGTATFLAYGIATIPQSIWFGRPWSAYLLGAFDALLYALLAGGIFGWLWH